MASSASSRTAGREERVEESVRDATGVAAVVSRREVVSGRDGGGGGAPRALAALSRRAELHLLDIQGKHEAALPSAYTFHFPRRAPRECRG